MVAFILLVALVFIVIGIGMLICWPIATLVERTKWFKETMKYIVIDDDDDEAE